MVNRDLHTLGDVRSSVPPAQPAPQFASQGSQPMPAQQNQRQSMIVGNGDGGVWPKMGEMLSPGFRFDTFVFASIVVQIIMFIVELVYGAIAEDGAFVAGNAGAGPGGDTFLALGAKYLPLIQAPNWQVYRFITPAFLHASIMHIAFNLFFQFAIAFRLEAEWGPLRMAALFFVTAWGATLLSCFGTPSGIAVGASGALFGYLGAELVFVALNWSSLRNAKQRMCNLILLLFFNFIFSFVGTGIDVYAHLGGFITGLMLGVAICEPMGAFPDQKRAIQFGAWAFTAVYLAGMTAGVFFLNV
eukprot:148437_1